MRISSLRGENIVVGVIDSGIAPNHPSLLDTDRPDPARAAAAHWAEASLLGLWLCSSYRVTRRTRTAYDAAGRVHAAPARPGPGFEPTVLQQQGRRRAVLRRRLPVPQQARPARVSFAARRRRARHARRDDDRRQLGRRVSVRHAVARVQGLAPRARVAVYKACWVEPDQVQPTCATSDLARAVDDAVADGVDIINYSLGSNQNDITEPDGLALLNAFDAGVLAVVAAGNDGPNYGTISRRAARRG